MYDVYYIIHCKFKKMEKMLYKEIMKLFCYTMPWNIMETLKEYNKSAYTT